MGLMDVLNGMANGPRGPAEPGKRGGISPITMGLLALLAYKTMRGEGALGGLFCQANAPAGNAPAGNAPSAPPQAGAGGGLLDWLQNGLGGALAGGAAGGAAGSVVSGGLNELLKHLQQNGLGMPASPGSAMGRTSRYARQSGESRRCRHARRSGKGNWNAPRRVPAALQR